MTDSIFTQHENQISIMLPATPVLSNWSKSLEQPVMDICCTTAQGYVTQLKIHAKETGSILLQNKFETALLAISDDVKVEQFDDMIQKVICCEQDAFFPLDIVKDRNYHISAVY